jgi:hypothetical protein
MNTSDSDHGTNGTDDEGLTEALSKRVPVPPVVLARLRAERETLGETKAAQGKVIAFPGTDSRPARHRLWNWMAAAAVIAILGVVGYQMRPRDDTSSASIVTRSPQGTVATTQPEVAWENTPGKSYNVWILPKEGDYTTASALFVARNVRSPLPFSALKPGKDVPPDKKELDPDKEYRLLVCYHEAGGSGPGERIAGTPVPFRVVSPPPSSNK